MKLKNTNKTKRTYKSYLVACLAGILTFILSFSGLFVSVNNSLSDILYQRGGSADLPITIIAIDESTLAALGQYTTWNRGIYADLINRICTENSSPSVIALDVLFTGDKDEAGDKKFVEACRNAGNVIVGMSLEYDSVMAEDNGNKYIDYKHIKNIILPYDELNEAATSAYVKNSEDMYDNYARTLITYVEADGRIYDGLGLSALKLYAEKNGITLRDYNSESKTQFRFSYTGGPYSYGSGSFNVVPFIDVYNGSISADALNGEIVLIGGFANAFGDAFYVPTGHGQKMYGIEIHANIIEALYKEKLQDDASQLIISLICALIALCLTFVLLAMSPLAGGLVTAAVILVSVFAGIISYKSGIYFGVFELILVPLIIYAGMIIYHYLSERAVKAKISKAFKMYVAPQIVDEVAAKGNYELQLGGRNKDIAVLFVDIRGFTPMSESLKPEQVVEILNEYFAIITDAIFKNGGTLDKFIGDAAMAVFNSPFDLDDYVYRAVKTGWDIAAGSKILEKKLMDKYGRTVSYGVGVNAGEAVIGNIGCEFRMDYTAIGDTVNTSARLESNAKAGQILISETVYEQVKDRIEVEPIGEIPLKGKSKGVFVYNVTNIL